MAADELDPDSPVADTEKLWRRLLPGTCAIDSDGLVRISREAYLDRVKRPSVDRAALRDAESARERTENGVAHLNAGRVRRTAAESRDQRGRIVVQHTTDVVPAPIREAPGNLAHAEITMNPEKPTDGAFRKLREQLALISDIEIEPPGLRPPRTK